MRRYPQGLCSSGSGWHKVSEAGPDGQTEPHQGGKSACGDSQTTCTNLDPYAWGGRGSYYCNVPVHMPQERGKKVLWDNKDLLHLADDGDMLMEAAPLLLRDSFEKKMSVKCLQNLTVVTTGLNQCWPKSHPQHPSCGVETSKEEAGTDINCMGAKEAETASTEGGNTTSISNTSSRKCGDREVSDSNSNHWVLVSSISSCIAWTKGYIFSAVEHNNLNGK